MWQGDRMAAGNFDVVPEVSGTYDALMQRAIRLPAYGQAIWVAHVDDLLATVTVPRRTMDIPRVQALRASNDSAEHRWNENNRAAAATWRSPCSWSGSLARRLFGTRNDQIGIGLWAPLLHIVAFCGIPTRQPLG